MIKRERIPMNLTTQLLQLNLYTPAPYTIWERIGDVFLGLSCAMLWYINGAIIFTSLVE